MGSLLFLDITFAVFTVLLLKKIFTKPSTPLPPGPPKLPLLDNLLDFPTDKAWITFSDWGKKWGDIVSISALGQHLVILNSAKTAVEMLDKKSAIYSDRPILQMGGELVGWKNTLGLLPYGDYCKYFHQLMGNIASASLFYPVEELKTHKLLKRVVENPDDLAAHIHKYEVKEWDDPFITLADEAMSQISLASVLGTFLVNFFPPLRHIPAWFTGAGFKRTAVRWAEMLTSGKMILALGSLG
ncbi:cytochrome P450 [Phlegmacium glaucopus]|nr:cytochrome P450 [Phlegmacium glaucopus]